jgi:DNA-directed RNA polymerase subunit N (RpoN/RPB10)
MSEGTDEVEVPIRCEACGTSGAVPLDAVAERIEQHNERLHDGEAVAEVDPAIADRVADLVAADLGLLEE